MYTLLAKSLARAGIENSGTLANLLLETFVCNSGELHAGLAVERGLCKEGAFAKWRNDLIHKGWIMWTAGNYSRHEPGAKLVKYINKEKLTKREIATMRDVHGLSDKLAQTREEMATKEELAKVREEVRDLKQVVTDMIAEFDPPVTQEKVERRLKIVKT